MNKDNGIFTARCQFEETVVGACWWWLRSPGHESWLAADVGLDGIVGSLGYFVGIDRSSVRPVVVVLP